MSSFSYSRSRISYLLLIMSSMLGLHSTAMANHTAQPSGVALVGCFGFRFLAFALIANGS